MSHKQFTGTSLTGCRHVVVS